MYVLLMFSILHASAPPIYEAKFKTVDACLAMASRMNGPNPDALFMVDTKHIHICYKLVAPT
jgi:hypothetical protein